MSLSNLFLALFLALLSLQLGLSMELPQVAWVGGGLSLLASLRIISLERPTWGLVFVLLATGGLVGSQVLEDWAVEGSWAQTNGLGAGIVLTILIYLLWLFAARDKSSSVPAASPPPFPAAHSGSTFGKSARTIVPRAVRIRMPRR